jgi:hypothetical protein
VKLGGEEGHGRRWMEKEAGKMSGRVIASGSARKAAAAYTSAEYICGHSRR